MRDQQHPEQLRLMTMMALFRLSTFKRTPLLTHFFLAHSSDSELQLQPQVLHAYLRDLYVSRLSVPGLNLELKPQAKNAASIINPRYLPLVPHPY